MLNFMKKIRFMIYTTIGPIYLLPTRVATAQVDIPEPTPPPPAIRKAFGLDPFYQQWNRNACLASAKVNPYAVNAYLKRMIGNLQIYYR